MNTRTLGLIGIICSPFLAVQSISFGIFEHYQDTSLSGIFGLIFMTGWYCSIVGLYKLNAAGKSKTGKSILIIQLLFLTLGEIFNIYSIIRPGSNDAFYCTLDMFWPLSNIFMFITGLVIMAAKQLHGWRRFVPLFVGLWFPITVVIARMIFGTGTTTLAIISFYSIIGWALLGWSVYTEARQRATSFELRAFESKRLPDYKIPQGI